MQALTLYLLCAVVAGAFAGGQYYVPRSYYVIDAEGHESAPVPLRRLRRSLHPGSQPGWGDSNASANANANANANAGGWGGGSASANAEAHANANAGSWGAPPSGWDAPPSGGWGSPGSSYGASKPLSAGMTSRSAGPIVGARSVSARSSIGINSSGQGYYDQATSVDN